MSENKNLTPVWIIYVDGKRLDVKHEGALRKITVKDCLNRIGTFSVLFDTGETKVLKEKMFSRGSKISIHMGYKDDVDEVFSGIVCGFRSIFLASGVEQVEVFGANVLYKLDRAEHLYSFEEKSPSDVLKALIENYSLTADVDSFGTVKPFSSQEGETDYAFLLRIAGNYGMNVFANEDTIYIKDEISIRTDEVIFEWGKSLISFDGIQTDKKLLSGFDYMGWDYLKNESFVGSAKLSDIRVKVGGSKDWTKNADGNTSIVSVRFSQGAKDSEDAKKLAIGSLQDNSFMFGTASGTAEGNYKLRPGMRVTIKMTNDDTDGEYMAETVTHSLSQMEGFRTSFMLKRNMLL